MTTVAFIGLGNMGLPMAKNLIAAGFTVRGHDVVDACRAAAADAGVELAGAAPEAMEGADAVITMLPKGEHVRAVYFGAAQAADGSQPSNDDGILAHATPEQMLIDSSTVDIATCQAVHDAAAAKGLHFVDAPVSGGISGAEAGSLTFMVGGADADVERARQFIEPMCGNFFATGDPTTGEAAKIVNNMMLFVAVQGLSEAATLTKKLGLDAKTFHQIASVSSGNSWALQTWYPVPGVVETAAVNNEFAASFRADLALKDIGLALAAAADHGLHLPATGLSAQRLAEAVDGGGGELDCTVVIAAVDPDAEGLPEGYVHGGARRDA